MVGPPTRIASQRDGAHARALGQARKRRHHRQRAGGDDAGERQSLAHAGDAGALVIIRHQFGAPGGIGHLHRGEAEIEQRRATRRDTTRRRPRGGAKSATSAAPARDRAHHDPRLAPAEPRPQPVAAEPDQRIEQEIDRAREEQHRAGAREAQPQIARVKRRQEGEDRHQRNGEREARRGISERPRTAAGAASLIPRRSSR